MVGDVHPFRDRLRHVRVASITPHGGTWIITPPRSRTIWARTRRAVDALIGAETAIEQLGVQQQEIVAQQAALEARLLEQRRLDAALRRSEIGRAHV